jgi:hypothetical protein
LLMLGACASTPPAPTANLRAARQAIDAAERGEAARSDPVADNDSAAGRQQNRRVEVLISNPPAALR